jgi:hypothetical protein
VPKTDAISAIQLLLNQIMHHTVELFESRLMRVRSAAPAAGFLLFVNHVGDLYPVNDRLVVDSKVRRVSVCEWISGKTIAAA